MAKNKLFDENGNQVKGKIKKPFYKKIWFWVVAVVLIAIIGGSMGGEDEVAETEQPKVTNESTEVAENETNEVESTEPEISREFQNALKSAQNYVDIMPFSEKGLYDQLTAESGDQFPEDAAQYAIENVDVDYNEEALEAAKNYQETMPMSDSGLHDQLISDYGDKFTEEQAQYAIDNLE